MSAGQVIAGLSLSSTVTVALQVDESPLLPLIVSVTVFVPKSPQLKELLLIPLLAIPQLSLEPPSTSATISVALPDPFKTSVFGWQVAIGGVLSLTVTVEVHASVVPAGSVTVSVTVFPPMSPQSKAVMSADSVTEQLSVLPPSISAAVIVAFPAASRLTGMS